MRLWTAADAACTQAVQSSACNNAMYKHLPGEGEGCRSALALWTVAFSCCELFLSQLADFHSLWCAIAPLIHSSVFSILHATAQQVSSSLLHREVSGLGCSDDYQGIAQRAAII